MTSVSPFELTVSGNATIPLLAERALINVSVSSQGNNKTAVSDEVITTSKHVESILREYAPADESPEAKAAASLAHWNKTSLSSTSHVPREHMTQKELPREYTASVTYDIRFKEFRALGAFSTRMSSIAHVEVRNIQWHLTNATERSHRPRLRREAAMDAMEKAKDYCEVLGCSNVRPVQLEEGHRLSNSSSTMQPLDYQPQAMLQQQTMQQQMMMQSPAAQAAITRRNMQLRGMDDNGGEEKGTEIWSFARKSCGCR